MLERLRMLLQKSIDEELSIEEEQELNQLLTNSVSAEKERLFEELTDKNQLNDRYYEYYNIRKQSDEFLENTIPAKVMEMHPHKTNWLRYVAAAVVLILGFSMYLWQGNKKEDLANANTEQKQTQQEIMPANGAAILILDNGQQITLDSVGNGIVAMDGGKEIIKQDGQLSYLGEGREIAFNTLFTNKGKTMSLRLPDGSHVWLNAESSIRFPTTFDDKERIVELTGEAYFEIAKDAAKPFTVSVNNMSVQVLGTHFNINGYTDEATIKTTLLEGSIKVSVNNAEKIIKPGEQVQVADGGAIGIVNNANVDEVMAWKNARFYFDRADISTVMRQLLRWYNIEVVYESEKPKQLFAGEMERNLNLSQVLRALEHAGIRFKIEGRKLIVMP